MKKFMMLTALTTTLLSGCATHHQHNTATSSSFPNYSPLEIVAQESQKALIAQQTLTKYKDAKLSTLDVRQRNFDTDKIVVDYIGKPRALLSSIAIKYGYRFIEMGTQRDLPIANFTQVYGTPADIIASLDVQLQDQANITIDKNEKTITLIY